MQYIRNACREFITSGTTTHLLGGREQQQLLLVSNHGVDGVKIVLVNVLGLTGGCGSGGRVGHPPKVGCSIPASPSPHADVSVGKTLLAVYECDRKSILNSSAV